MVFSLDWWLEFIHDDSTSYYHQLKQAYPHPDEQNQPDPRTVPESEPVEKSSTEEELVDAPAEDRSYQMGLGCDALVPADAKRKRKKRQRGGWIVGCRSDPFYKLDFRLCPVIGAGGFNEAHTDPLEAEGASVHERSGGERKIRSRKRSKGWEKRPKNWLPQGWRVICKTRCNCASAGVVDKYYVEPVTLKRFRSRVQMKRHLKMGTPKKMGNRKKKEAL